MSDDKPSGIQETFISHLIELRTRMVRASAVVLVVFIVLFTVWPGAAALYDFMAQPMLHALPEGSKMIATGVITPFMVPMKITMAAALMLSLPWVLYQAWASSFLILIAVSKYVKASFARPIFTNATPQFFHNEGNSEFSSIAFL